MANNLHPSSTFHIPVSFTFVWNDSGNLCKLSFGRPQSLPSEWSWALKSVGQSATPGSVSCSLELEDVRVIACHKAMTVGHSFCSPPSKLFVNPRSYWPHLIIVARIGHQLSISGLKSLPPFSRPEISRNCCLACDNDSPMLKPSRGYMLQCYQGDWRLLAWFVEPHQWQIHGCNHKRTRDDWLYRWTLQVADGCGSRAWILRELETTSAQPGGAAGWGYGNPQ